MIEAIFENGSNDITVRGLTQWDKGQMLKIKYDDMPNEFQVHFAHAERREAIVRLTKREADSAVVEIPDSLLRQKNELTAWVYVTSGESGETVKTIHMPITARKKPEDYIAEPGGPYVIEQMLERMKKMEEVLNGILERPEPEPPATPDWAENDINSSAYIENRTHYVNDSKTLNIPAMVTEENFYSFNKNKNCFQSRVHRTDEECVETTLRELDALGIDYKNNCGLTTSDVLSIAIKIDGKLYFINGAYRVETLGSDTKEVIICRDNGMPVIGILITFYKEMVHDITYEVYIYFASGNLSDIGIGPQYGNGYDEANGKMQGKEYSFTLAEEDIVKLPDRFLSAEIVRKTDIARLVRENQRYPGIANYSVAGLVKAESEPTITGAGIERRRVSIETSGYLKYDFPKIANGITKGLCNPVEKTAEMTQPVGIDAEGRLWISPIN